MKRSEINRLILEATEFFRAQNFHLPPFAYWTPGQWQDKGPECDEIRDNLLGWDLTDFGSGDFHATGLLLFTLRNGNQASPKYAKPYAEKIMIVREHQVTPMHFHWSKMEDIINRGGGDLVIELNHADPENEGEFLDTPFQVTLDGVARTFDPGEIVRLNPGASITLERHIYHRFWAEGATTLVGEVSCVNDDSADNRFHEPIGRFPEIEEDEPAVHLLCTEYPPASCP